MSNISTDLVVSADGASNSPSFSAVGFLLWAVGFFVMAGLLVHTVSKPTPMDVLRAEREQSRLARLAGFKAVDDSDILFAGCYATQDGREGRVFSAPGAGYNGGVNVSFGDSASVFRFRSLRRTICE
ncbi:hypothetical protein [Rhizobium sp. BK176]|uniref:hypothetical protein n=1 Tax=Rhizobium sp. BK176 TaxID=2587071 RepID=UPI0021670767|nr:hypothetical protein [Rhizobium sp. BK176]MCS4089393.1 hypothetical protein [Rhizobium sp. BK176]